jgi:hypothetical protein
MPPKMETASGYLERKGAASMENLKTDNEKRKYKTLLAADNARVKAATAHEIELKRAENGMLDEEELKDLKKGKDLDDADERIGDRLTKEETDEMSKAQIKEYYDDLKAEKLRKQQNGGGSDGESSESPFEPDEASGSSESDNSVDSEVSEDVDEALDLAVKSTRKEVKADLKKEKKKKKKEKGHSHTIQLSPLCAHFLVGSRWQRLQPRRRRRERRRRRSRNDLLLLVSLYLQS